MSEQYFLALSLRPYRSEVAPPPSPRIDGDSLLPARLPCRLLLPPREQWTVGVFSRTGQYIHIVSLASSSSLLFLLPSFLLRASRFNITIPHFIRHHEPSPSTNHQPPASNSGTHTNARHSGRSRKDTHRDTRDTEPDDTTRLTHHLSSARTHPRRHLPPPSHTSTGNRWGPFSILSQPSPFSGWTRCHLEARR